MFNPLQIGSGWSGRIFESDLIDGDKIGVFKIASNNTYELESFPDLLSPPSVGSVSLDDEEVLSSRRLP